MYWGIKGVSSMDKDNATTGSALSSRTFSSITQCAGATGYDKKILLAAKKSGAPGFTPHNRIHWDKLEPYLIAHKLELETAAGHSLEFFKTEIAKRDVVLRDLEIQKKKEEAISPDEIKQFLTTFGTLLSSVLKKKREEMMSKATGYESLIDKEFQDVFTL